MDIPKDGTDALVQRRRVNPTALVESIVIKAAHDELIKNLEEQGATSVNMEEMTVTIDDELVTGASMTFRFGFDSNGYVHLWDDSGEPPEAVADIDPGELATLTGNPGAIVTTHQGTVWFEDVVVGESVRVDESTGRMHVIIHDATLHPKVRICDGQGREVDWHYLPLCEILVREGQQVERGAVLARQHGHP
jgi:hypothetical protein